MRASQVGSNDGDNTKPVGRSSAALDPSAGSGTLADRAMSADRPTTLRCAGCSDAGMRRQNNEDRIYLDVARGFFMVVDGVGGQAAGERAADIAMTVVRAGVDEPAGPAIERLRTSIVAANNEIFHQSQSDSELAGMGCVLTAVVIGDATATVGHVGDTRLYKFRQGTVVKVTHDHSPVGEQEERGELSETAAMRHPLRNQVYRALGAAEKTTEDDSFVEIQQVPFEEDSALLLCSDGLTDLVPLAEITDVVERHALDPAAVVERLIGAANSAGGKDNVSVVFVAGAGFNPGSAEESDTTITHRILPRERQPSEVVTAGLPPASTRLRAPVIFGIGVALGAALAGAFLHGRPTSQVPPVAYQSPARQPRTIAVGPGADRASATIAGALGLASPGDTIVVAPGEYPEQITLSKPVTLTSLKPRDAVIIPQPGAIQNAAAVIIDVSGTARITGFSVRGAGDDLPIGILVMNGSAEIGDVEVSGTRDAAIEVATSSATTVSGASLRVSRGTGFRIRPGSAPRLAHNSIVLVGTSQTVVTAVNVQGDARPTLIENVFVGFGRKAVVGSSGADLERLLEGNVFTANRPTEEPRERPQGKPKPR